MLHPTDFSASAEIAFARAVLLAHQHEAELHLLHVAPTFGADPVRGAFEAATDEKAFYRRLRDEADQRMRTLVEKLGAGNVPVKRVHSHGTAPAAIIVEYAASEGIDLIVMGTRGQRDVRRILMGSVAREVAREAEVPVLVVRGPAETDAQESSTGAWQRILVPIDFSSASCEALRYACELAVPSGAALDLFHVVDLTQHEALYRVGLANHREVERGLKNEARRALQEALEEVSGEHACLAETADLHVVTGYPPHEIIERVREQAADLVVIASHGLRGQTRFTLGSTTDRVLREAPCSVLVPKPFARPLLPERSAARADLSKQAGA